MIMASDWLFMSDMKDSVSDVKRERPSSLVKVVPAEVADAFEWTEESSAWSWTCSFC